VACHPPAAICVQGLVFVLFVRPRSEAAWRTHPFYLLQHTFFWIRHFIQEPFLVTNFSSVNRERKGGAGRGGGRHKARRGQFGEDRLPRPGKCPAAEVGLVARAVRIFVIKTQNIQKPANLREKCASFTINARLPKENRRRIFLRGRPKPFSSVNPVTPGGQGNDDCFPFPCRGPLFML